MTQCKAEGYQGKTQLSFDDLPIPLHKVIDWGVYLWKSTRLCGPGHHSIVFDPSTTSSTPSKMIYVELLKDQNEVMLSCGSIDLDDSQYEKLRNHHLGTVRMSVADIVETSEKILKRLGSYNAVLNNCQVSILVYSHVCT